MPKIKLVKVLKFAADYDSYCVDGEMADSLSDWQDVTEDELRTLLSFEGTTILEKENVGVVVYKEETEKVFEYIKNIKDFIKEQEGKLQKRKEEAEEEARKRREKYEKNKIEKAKKLLQQKGLL